MLSQLTGGGTGLRFERMRRFGAPAASTPAPVAAVTMLHPLPSEDPLAPLRPLAAVAAGLAGGERSTRRRALLRTAFRLWGCSVRWCFF